MVAGNTPQFARKSFTYTGSKRRGGGAPGAGDKKAKRGGKKKKGKRGPVQGRLTIKHYIHQHHHNLLGKAASSYKYPTIPFL